MPRTDHEVSVHCAILDRLRLALPRAAARTLIHIPNGEERQKKTGALLERLGLRPGAADLHFLHASRAYYIEVKRGGSRSAKLRGIRKTYQTADQRQYQADVEAAGGCYGVARSSDEAVALCRGWGIPVRERPVQPSLLAETG